MTIYNYAYFNLPLPDKFVYRNAVLGAGIGGLAGMITADKDSSWGDRLTKGAIGAGIGGTALGGLKYMHQNKLTQRRLGSNQRIAKVKSKQRQLRDKRANDFINDDSIWEELAPR